jgi:predicted TIM-barrel fold metal-dependent hydrolase
MASEPPVIDIHTHVYPSTYISLLRSRTTVPYLLDPPEKGASPRLIILPTDDDPSLSRGSRGRPIDSSYTDIGVKLKFMSDHHIRASIISLANPWLDFLPPTEGLKWAHTINDELESTCSRHQGKLWAFATLPLSASPSDIITEIDRLRSLPHIRGIIMGTTGLSNGLDDPNLDSIWAALEESKLLIFLHPHYGLPSSLYGPRANEYGHVLPLSLGFPMETTIAFTRMWLSGVFDRYPKLKLLIAHSGGTIPFLAGRIDSCVQHERHFPEHTDENGIKYRGPKRSLDQVLSNNIWLDAVVYSETGVKAAVEKVGRQRVLFGTDHPFFPPLEEGLEKWASVETNIDAVTGGRDNLESRAILGGNAIELLGLEIDP